VFLQKIKMKTSKQVIVMRKDLNMRKGKMVAQGAHASMKAVLDLMSDKNEKMTLHLGQPGYEAMKDWIEGRFTKVCLSVNSEKEMLELYQKAKEKGLICSLITDAGLTEFGGVPTKTCIAIGPNWSNEIDEITGHLSLL
jgi:PTH2 family peptidyl-tRNA hydrolase